MPSALQAARNCTQLSGPGRFKKAIGYGWNKGKLEFHGVPGKGKSQEWWVVFWSDSQPATGQHVKERHQLHITTGLSPYCKPFLEPRNQFQAWRAGTTTLFVVLARQAGRIDSSESISGLLKRLQIRSLFPAYAPAPRIIPNPSNDDLGVLQHITPAKP
jgi:hypothetical protein